MTAIRLLLIACLTLVFSSCKPKPTPHDGPIDAQIYQLVKLDYEGEDLQESYDGDIDGVPVKLNRINSSTLGFVVPEMAVGSHTLDFELDSLELNVLAAPAVNAAQVLQTYENEYLDLISALDQMDRNGMTEEQIERLDEVIDLANNFLADVSSLSEQDKKNLALALSVNKMVPAEGPSVMKTSAALTQKSALPDGFCSDEPQPVTKFVSSMGTLEKIGSMMELYFSLVGPVGGGLYLAAIVNSIPQTSTSLKILAAGTAIGLVAIWIRHEIDLALTQAQKFICEVDNNFSMASSLRTLSKSTMSATVASASFVHDVPKSFIPKMYKRAINASDLSKGETYKLYLERLFLFNDIAPSLPAAFGIKPLNFDESTVDYSPVLSNLSYSISGNPDVEMDANGTTLTVRSKSHEDENFSLKVSYTVGSYVTSQNFGASVTYENIAPVADFTFTTQDLKVTFNPSTSKDEDGEIVKYVWNLGDGSGNRETQNLTYTYLEEGTYNVRLTVTDDKGKTHSVVKAVEVKEEQTCIDVFKGMAGTWTFKVWSNDIEDGEVIEYANSNLTIPNGTPTFPARVESIVEGSPIAFTYSCSSDSLTIEMMDEEDGIWFPMGTISTYSKQPRNKQHLIFDREDVKFWVGRPEAF